MDATFFTAAYQDGYAYLGRRHYNAGTFAVHLLNDFYKDDLAARLSVFKNVGWQVLDLLSQGTVAASLLVQAGWELQQILKVLPRLQPFKLLNIPAEQERIAVLFTEEAAVLLRRYFHLRGIVGQAEEIQVIYAQPEGFDKKVFHQGERLVSDIRQTITLYHSISDDMRFCFNGLRQFVTHLEEAERLDEAHLLPIALDIFKSRSLSLNMEYISVRPTAKGPCTVARKLIFDRYRSFLLTDFFEGLHHGHYPKQCQICGKYFLMGSARPQRYCGGWSGIVEKGRKLSCRQYAVRIGKKELAEADPRKDLYNRRCACIRSEQSRGTITPEFAQAAKAIAKRRLNAAIMDPAYAATQFEQDLQRAKLYADVKVGWVT